jgi:hypothetical protein
MPDYILWLYLGAIPLFLLVVITAARRYLRRSVGKSMGPSAARSVGTASADVSQGVAELQIRMVNASSVSTPLPYAAAGIQEAKVSRRTINTAFLIPAIVFTTLVTGAMVGGMFSLHGYSKDGPLAVTYMMQWVPLVIVLWFVDLPFRTRLLVLSGYLAMGLALALFASNLRRVIQLFEATVSFQVLNPLAVVALLLIRRLRPWLLVMVGVLLFVAIGVALMNLTGMGERARERVHVKFGTWAIVYPLVFPILAMILVGWLLQRDRWKPTIVMSLGALTLVGIIFYFLHLPVVSVGLLELPANVLEILLFWAIFKGFVLLQERQWLPTQVLHSHLCWGALTLYLLALTVNGRTLFGNSWWRPWALVLSYLLYIVLLHAILHRSWRSRVSRSGKRLLLLRVFGKADQSERLLDSLDNSWRFVGRIDLVAGTDLAERALGALMLEAFLLRRTDQLFLKTGYDVRQRLANLRSGLEGDLRYPVNSVYCYASAWREVVELLAPKSDAVLMDLRGFSRRNQGCVFELTWIVQWLSLARILLLTDGSTDYAALKATVHEAWSTLPPTSPSVGQRRPLLTLVEANGSISARDGIFALLLNAAAS